MPKNQKYKKSIVTSFRIDEEFADLIFFLKEHHINWQQLIYENAKSLLKNKAVEFKLKIKQEKIPF